MGEALSQAQRVAAERDSLAALLAGGVDRPGMDLAALAGCSAGSPRTTRSGWPSSASPPSDGPAAWSVRLTAQIVV